MRLVAYEGFVLRVLDWQLHASSPSSFADAYHAKGLFSDDDTTGSKHNVPPSPQAQGRVFEHARFFCNLATLHGMSCTFGDSVSAASSVAAARAVNSIHPVWPEQLAQRLGHAFGQIHGCTQALLRIYSTAYARAGEEEICKNVQHALAEELPDCVGCVLEAQVNTTASSRGVDASAAPSLCATPLAECDDEEVCAKAHESPTNVCDNIHLMSQCP